MSRHTFEGIAKGLREAIDLAQSPAHETRKSRTARTRPEADPTDMKTARKQVGLSRRDFAHAFGLSPATLRRWENGERRPTGAARALLTIIAREPEAVLRVVRG